jgi:thiol-disulfide isomerase/thioredoxin
MRLLILILLALSFNTAMAAPPPESFDRMNAAFPDITFVTPEGKTSSLSEYKGKVVVVKLWATWCGICRAKWPEYQALYDSVKDESDVQFITLSVVEDPQVSQLWVDQQGYKVPLFKNLINDRGAVQVADDSFYFIKGTPMKFLIDKNGVLRKKAVGNSGSITEADIRGLI